MTVPCVWLTSPPLFLPQNVDTVDQVLVQWAGTEPSDATWASRHCCARLDRLTSGFCAGQVAKDKLVDCARLVEGFQKGEQVSVVKEILGRRCVEGVVVHLVAWADGGERGLRQLGSRVANVEPFKSPPGSQITTSPMPRRLPRCWWA